MKETLHDYCRQFWICLAAGMAFAILSYIQIWRRHVWLRFLDAEELFLARPPKGGLGRRFGEGRYLPVWSIMLAVVLLIIAVLNAYEYFHYLHALPST